MEIRVMRVQIHIEINILSQEILVKEEEILVKEECTE